MATQAILMKKGTPVTFQESGGTVTFTLSDGVAAGNGQVSNQWNRGTDSLPMTYQLDAVIRWADTATLGDVVRIYLYSSDTTSADLTADGDVTPESKFGNFDLVGQVTCTVAANQSFYRSFLVQITGRYVNLGVWNASATKTLHATDNVSNITLTPVYPEIQAAV